MLFSCFFTLGFLAWIGISVYLACNAETRKPGFISLASCLMLTTLFLWWADSGNMKSEPPAMEEIIGTWECYRVSPAYLRKAGVKQRDVASRLIFESESRVRVERLPDEGAFLSFTRGWELKRPGLTPAGAWTIETGEHRLVCRRKLGRMTLRKTVDRRNDYVALYRRVPDNR